MLELSPENRHYLEAIIAAGDYPNALAPLDEAVLLLRRRDETRRKLQAAVDQADRGELIPAEQVFARLEQRASAIQQNAGRAHERPVLYAVSGRGLGLILQDIARDRPETVVRIAAEIRQKCEFIAANPDAGEWRPEISELHRCWPVRRWVIFYRSTPNRVEIHRILDGARDLGAILGQ